MRYDYLATAMSRKVLLLSRYVCNCVVMFITSFLTVIVIMAKRLGGQSRHCQIGQTAVRDCAVKFTRWHHRAVHHMARFDYLKLMWKVAGRKGDQGKHSGNPDEG